MLAFNFETEDGTVVTGPVLFRDTVRGIPNRAVSLYIRNTGDEDFTGEVYISPGDGQSFSEDLMIAEMQSGNRVWTRSFYTTISPDQRIGLYMRVNPTSTPSDTSGTANILFSRS